MFMLGEVAALVINYPNVAEQRARIDAHAKAALLMASILFAAGPASGARGAATTGLLNVSIGYRDSFIGEGQMSYDGEGALRRAELALQIVEERLKLTGVEVQ